MSDVEIGARIKLDAGNSGKTIQELRDNLKGAKKELADTKIGTDEYEKALKKLEAAEGALSPKVKDSSGAFGVLKEKVAGMVPALDGASGAGNTFNGVLNLLRANPIVFVITSLVAILVGLYKAFESTFDGGRKLEQVFAGIRAAAQVLQDRLVKLAGAVTKLFSGDFKGAMNDAKSSVTGLGDEVQRVYNRTSELTKQLQKIKDEERSSNVDEAQRETRLALLREQLNDENVSMKEKKRIALELKKDVDENYADDLRRDREKARIKIELLKQQKDGERKNADEIAQIQIDLYKAETANALEGVRVNRQIRALDTQEKAANAAADKERAAKAKELRAKAIEEEKDRAANQKAFNDEFRKLQFDNELLAISDENQRKLLQLDIQLKEERRLVEQDFQLRKITLQQKSQLLSEYTRTNELNVAAIRAAVAKEAADTEEKLNLQRTNDMLAHTNRITAELKANSDAQIAQSKLEADEKVKNQQTVVNALGALSSFIGEQTVIGKGLAAAAAVINTYQGATKALAQGGLFGFIGAAAVIASGLASVRKILSTQIPGKGSGGAAGPSISAAATSQPVTPPAPQNTTTQLDTNSVQAIGNAANKSYVVERDMTNNQEKVRQLNRAARIG